ncbi:DUF1877 family protein [Streptomyces sp. NPDC055078]
MFTDPAPAPDLYAFPAPDLYGCPDRPDPPRVLAGRSVAGSLGRHFAIPPADAERLVRAGADEVTAYIDSVEDGCEPRWTADTDRAWGTLHRCLADGTLRCGTGPYPLSYAFLGGRLLPVGAYIATLVTPAQTRRTAPALAGIGEEWLRGRFPGLRAGAMGREAEWDFRYLWEHLVSVRRFYARAAGAGRAVLFTADV